MDASVKRQFLEVMLRLKKADLSLFPALGLSKNELMMLSKVFGRRGELEEPVNVSDLHNDLRVSRPAISQMLNNLEKKGLIAREIANDDRRKISVALTADGKDVLREAEIFHDQIFQEITEQFGEENVQALLSLLIRLADICEGIKIK